MSHYSDAMYNRMATLKNRVKNIFSKAHSFHLSNKQIGENLNRDVYEHPEYKKLNQYYQGLINGTINCLYDVIWENNVTWQLFLDGNPKTFEEISAEIGGMMNKGNRVTGAHVWKQSKAIYTEQSPI